MLADFQVQRRTATALLLAAICTGAWAQNKAVPGASEMIEALKPSTAGTKRALIVRPVPAESVSGVAPGPAPAAAPSISHDPAPAGANITSAGSGNSVATPSLSLAIQFEPNSSRVRPESGELLGNLVAALQAPELKGARFAIEGHTDARGSAASNQRLSQERAEEVRLYLVALGVHPARLRAVGRGSSELANPLDPLAAENRRVRVVTLP